MLNVVSVSSGLVWIVWSGVNILLLLAIFLSIHKLCRNCKSLTINKFKKSKAKFENKNRNQSQPPISLSLLYIIMSSMCILCFIIFGVLKFYQKEESIIFINLSIIFTAIYIIKYYILLFILLKRLENIFKNTALALSSILINCFKIIIFLQSIIHLTISILSNTNDLILNPNKTNRNIRGTNLWELILGLLWCIQRGLFILFVALFLYKLSKCFTIKDENQRIKIDPSLLNIIKKISLTTVIALIISIISTIFVMLRFRYFNHMILNIISNYLVTIEIFADYLCVILTLKIFDNEYIFLCGCLDNKCSEKLWITLHNKRIIKQQSEIRENENDSTLNVCDIEIISERNSIAMIHSYPSSNIEIETSPSITTPISINNNQFLDVPTHTLSSSKITSNNSSLSVISEDDTLDNNQIIDNESGLVMVDYASTEYVSI